MKDINTMIETARAALKMAHAPYSNFRVGVCLKTQTGKIFSGCNIENASYGLTQCAEATAIAHMIMAGEKNIIEMAVLSESDMPCSPCGACRQRIVEFSSSETVIHICSFKGLHKSMTIAELFPESFTTAHLKFHKD